jgi:hypothetical protein
LGVLLSISELEKGDTMVENPSSGRLLLSLFVSFSIISDMGCGNASNGFALSGEVKGD